MSATNFSVGTWSESHSPYTMPNSYELYAWQGSNNGANAWDHNPHNFVVFFAGPKSDSALEHVIDGYVPTPFIPQRPPIQWTTTIHQGGDGGPVQWGANTPEPGTGLIVFAYIVVFCLAYFVRQRRVA